MTLSLSPSLSLSFSMQIQTIRLCSLYSLASSLDLSYFLDFIGHLEPY
jgi:hypothetical protein